MPRDAGVFWDGRARCWATSALGELKATKGGKAYRSKVYNRALTDPKDKKRARQWLDEELEKRDSKLVPVGQLTVEKVSQYYLYDVESKVAAATYENCRWSLNRALDWPAPDDPRSLARVPAEGLTVAMVEPFVAHLVESGLSEVYITNQVLKTLKRMFSWASTVREGLYPGLPLRSNPIARLRGPTLPRRAFRDVKPLAISRFLRWAWRRALGYRGRRGRFERATVVLLLALRDTGARPKELCVAEWSELKQRADGWGLITLPWWKWKNGPKQKKPRLIAVPPHVMARIAALRILDGYHPTRIFARAPIRGAEPGEGETPDTGSAWVWYDPKTRRSGDTRALQKTFRTLVFKAKAAGVDLPDGFRSYWLRSSFSTNAQRRGVRLAILAESMGTSEGMLAKSYTDMDEDDIVSAARGSFGPPKA